MKKFFCFPLLSLMLIQFVHGQDVQFFGGSWEEALKQARLQNKYILVDAYTTWCGPCKRMDAEKFHSNKEVADFINEHFIAFKADCEKSPTAALAMKFKVISYPTLLFFNPGGQLVNRSLGYNASQEEFLKPFRKSLSITDKQVFSYDSHQLDPGFPDLYKKVFKVDTIKPVKPSAEEVTNYLDARKDKFSEVSWAVMYVFSFPGQYRQFFIDNYEDYYTLYNAEASDAIRKIASADAAAAMKNKDENALNTAISLLEKYVPDQAGELSMLWKISFYQATQQWKKFADAAQIALEQDGYQDQVYINRFCRTIYQSCDDAEILKQATGWLDHIRNELKSYEILDIYASLLYKINRSAEAAAVAQKAIDAGVAENKNVESTRQLLARINGPGASQDNK